MLVTQYFITCIRALPQGMLGDVIITRGRNKLLETLVFV